MSGPSYVYETFIAAGPERIWEALTSGEFTRRYFHRTAVTSAWTVGAEVLYTLPDGREAVRGEVLEFSPPHRLVITWQVLYSEELAGEPPSRVCFEIEARGPVCRLRVTHDRFEDGSAVHDQVRQGWSAILSSLKTLLETGRPLAVAGNEPEEESA